MCNYQERKIVEKNYRKEVNLKSGKQLIIRTAKQDDAQELVDQMKILDSETKFLAREPGEFSFTYEQEQSFIEKSNNNENMLFLLAEIDGKIVGNCSVGIISNNMRYRHRASMGIAVLKSHWGLGIGRLLISECIKWCEIKSLNQLELDVVTENQAAISLYESLGFERYGRKKCALKYSDGSYADEHFMIKFI
jgi:RimJ/RimL family protein N-acetyltransferase